MSSNIWRLVRDMSPLMRFLAVFMLLYIGFGDWLVLGLNSNIPIHSGIFSAGVTVVGYLSRTPVWRQLPLSVRELGRAQWWLLLGLPSISLALVLLIALAIRCVTGGLDAPGRHVIILLAEQLTVLGCLSLGVITGAHVRGRAGIVGMYANLILFMGTGLLLCFRWASDDAPPAAEPMCAAGFVLCASAALYAFPQLIPIPDVSWSTRYRTRSARPGRTAPTSRWHGWLALIVPLVQTCAMASLAIIAATWSANRFMPDLGSVILGFVPVTALVAGTVAEARVTPRLLGVLPMSMWTRTAALQLITPAFQIVFALATLIAAAIFDVGLTTDTLLTHGTALIVGIAILSLRVPLVLRYGRMVNLPVMAGMIAGFLILAARDIFEIAVPPALLFMATFIALMTILVAWVWTRDELLSDHRVYRPLPVRPGGRWQ